MKSGSEIPAFAATLKLRGARVGKRCRNFGVVLHDCWCHAVLTT